MTANGGAPADLQSAHARIAELTEALDDLRAHLARIQGPKQLQRDNTVQNLQSDVRLAAMRESLATAANVHRVRIAELEAALAERDALLRDILRSRSWRLTAPLRRLVRAVLRRGRTR